MADKLTRVLKESPRDDSVAHSVRNYEDWYHKAKQGGLATRRIDYESFSNLYYDLVTDFYEYGWGKSFHFAPRVPGESFEQSLARHEHFLAHMLGLRPGMLVADLGCGIGGPLMEIARFSGARIVGVNSNEYQIKRAVKHVEAAQLSHLADFMHGDFLNVDAPDSSFDAIYSIEATCLAPDKPSVYAEVFRLLKPGACFANYEYCMTDRFDPTNDRHQQLKADIELGGGLLEIDERQVVDDALHSVGFEVLETRDLSVQNGPSIPWYRPFEGTELSVTGLRRSKIGRTLANYALRGLEALNIVPEGAVQVSRNLNLCADAMVEAGRLGIFTPMYFQHVRKPE